MVPQKFFFTKGVGRHKDYLQSFELALRDAGIETQNLVTVSSIFPPGCQKDFQRRGVKYMKAGSIRFCVMSRNATNEPNRLIAAIRRFGYSQRQPAVRIFERASFFRRHGRKGGGLRRRLGGNDASHHARHRV